MPTDEWFKENPKVSAYIPQSLNEKLTEWMAGRNIKKVSQALTTILEEYLGVVQTEPIIQPNRDDRLEALEEKFESLFKIVQELRESIELREQIQASSQRVVQTELFPVEPIETTLSDEEAIAFIEAKQPMEVIEEETSDDEPDEILFEFLETEKQEHTKKSNDKEVEQIELIKTEVWTTPQIVEALGVSRSSLERWKREGTLPKTSKGHTILKWAGKEVKQPFGNLWEVSKPHSADPKTITVDPDSSDSDF
jgi:predicted DNA-binding transcriptional regulator AlpA